LPETTMSTTLIEENQKEEQQEEMVLLPLCEANRGLVARPDVYIANAVFTVGSLRLIDQAP
jgi:hypothetical protein